MRRRVRLVGIVVAVSAGAAVLGACDFKERTTVTDDAVLAQKISSVRLDSTSGGVILRGHRTPGKVSLHRSIAYANDKPTGPTYEVAGGVLTLRGCGDDCSVTYTIDLPAGLPVSGRTSTGEIGLIDMGTIQVATTSGRIRLDQITGTVDVRTTNGQITGRGLRGGRIRAQTSNGGIDLTSTTPQDIWAKTSNGSVTLTVPTGRYQVAARNSNGDKNLGVPNDPNGDHRLDATTSNGAITFKIAAS
ncbi:DUF4097 family beta strand repeat-containing protein [Actinomadura roseirufa]|uniref:DUF4097 family beta strand repeat-containing protein n=1 Tax=Actinomadura roseirufa TaxID=2094049 RepID=UPI0010414FB9|nr:DUF4097 family beta strand repeat-containing protein [Actinomadura roseirufa]